MKRHYKPEVGNLYLHDVRPETAHRKDLYFKVAALAGCTVRSKPGNGSQRSGFARRMRDFIGRAEFAEAFTKRGVRFQVLKFDQTPEDREPLKVRKVYRKTTIPPWPLYGQESSPSGLTGRS